MDPNSNLPRAQSECSEKALALKTANESALAQTTPLTSPEAARYIGLSDSWLRQSRMRGSDKDTPPHFKISKAVRYRREDLDAWLERHRVGGEAA
jgi:predicted DNA-binding transcriptional regulator AlpA